VKAHIEIKIIFKTLPVAGLHEVLKQFAQETKSWEFPDEFSNDYQSGHDSEAGFVVCLPRENLEMAAVAIANFDLKNRKTFRVSNIVPKNCSRLTIDNAIGMAFAKDFKTWLKTSVYMGAVETIGPIRTLADIMPGKISRKFFQGWLRTPTPTGHPNDIYELDKFICHLFRHLGKTRTWEIEPYLISDLGWKPETARWVITRIETGLELLRVDREF
jgi:hypothetical protein